MEAGKQSNTSSFSGVGNGSAGAGCLYCQRRSNKKKGKNRPYEGVDSFHRNLNYALR